MIFLLSRRITRHQVVFSNFTRIKVTTRACFCCGVRRIVSNWTPGHHHDCARIASWIAYACLLSGSAQRVGAWDPVAGRVSPRHVTHRDRRERQGGDGLQQGLGPSRVHPRGSRQEGHERALPPGRGQYPLVGGQIQSSASGSL